MKKVIRVLLLTCGTLCVALGIVGIFVPVLPTTPFVLLAAVCYARSSDRFYLWLLNNRCFGKYIQNYREVRGIPLREKMLAIVSLWLTIGFSILFVISAWWGQLALLGVALGVTIHLARIKTFKRDANAPLTVISSEKLGRDHG
jgi:hypothetical protein